MMAKIPIGLQLFAVRGECHKDLPAALKSIAEIGYEGVEPWDYRGDRLEWLGFAAADLRKMLDDNGIQCCGIHLHTQALMGDNLKRTVEMNRILGNRFLIIAMDKDRMSSQAGIAELKGILESAADGVKPYGMYVGYHAHGFDFADVDGETAWDRLFSSTRDDIIMQIDIGNSVGGGGDPIAALRKFRNRARSVHLKDYGGGPDSVIGEGKADWDEIFRLCETNQNTEWFVVEEGGPDGLGFDIPRRSLEALRRMGR
jgi:sugar phosphate isomerase/epimerase